MSRDRVKLTIRSHRFGTDRAGDEMLDLVRRAFGISSSEVREQLEQWGQLNIVCRPSQFAHFLIWRNNAGLPNSFQEMSPDLFTPPRDQGYVDVSKRTTQKAPLYG